MATFVSETAADSDRRHHLTLLVGHLGRRIGQGKYIRRDIALYIANVNTASRVVSTGDVGLAISLSDEISIPRR